jgi:hypothetical protein
MQTNTHHSSTRTGGSYAAGGVVLLSIAGLLIAQAGGSDRETFVSVAFLLGSLGLLCVIIGGVAIGIGLARD